MLELPYIKLKRKKKKGREVQVVKSGDGGCCSIMQNVKRYVAIFGELRVDSSLSTATLCQPSSFCLLLAQLRPVYLFLFLITLPFHELIFYLFIFLFNSPIWHVDRLSSAVLSKIRKMMREDDFFLLLFSFFFIKVVLILIFPFTYPFR